LDVPLVMGSVRQEGMIFMYEAFKKNLIRTEEDGLLAVIYGLQNVEKILKEYPRNRSSGSLDGKDMRNHTAPIVTDSLIKCPIRKVLLTLSAMEKNGTRQSKGYNYHFDHVLSFGSSFWLPTSPICVRTKRRGYFERVR
jgi:carboxylesterase type B